MHHQILALFVIVPAAVAAVGDDVSMIQLHEAKADPYAMYEGAHLLTLKRCHSEEFKDDPTHGGRALTAWLAAQNCSFASDEELLHRTPPKDGKCLEASIICHEATSKELLKEYARSERASKFRQGEVAGEKLPPFQAELRNSNAADEMRRYGQLENCGSFSVCEPAEFNSDFNPAFYQHYRPLEDLNSRLRKIVEKVNAATAKGLTRVKAEIAEPKPLTYKGRQIIGLRLTGPNWGHGKKRLVITSQIHAREWIAGISATYLSEMLARKAVTDPEFFEETQVVIIPVNNPDGFEKTRTRDRMWRKNQSPNHGARCEGVDLNRNFDADYHPGKEGQKCGETYSGDAPFSEPEAQVIKSIYHESPPTVALDLHSYGELIAGAWAFTTADHPRKAEIHSLGHLMQEKMNRVHQQQYHFGTGDVDGLLYTCSGTLMDWASKDKTLGYVIELRGNDFVLHESEILPTAEELYEGVGTALKWMDARVSGVADRLQFDLKERYACSRCF